MGTGKLIVVAIGGNSLIEDTKHVTVKSQYEAAQKTAANIARLVQSGHQVVIAHGNGPQVGFALLRSEIAQDSLFLEPLDTCVANTQGTIGYQLQMALHNELVLAKKETDVVTVVTQVEVSRTDPSFSHPTKPIGSFMSEEEALIQKQQKGWDIAEDANRGYRRVVPSPKPISIVELDTIRTLVNSGAIVIAAGGGGIPVEKNEHGELVGLEAVIDKDLAAALLAKELNADLFVISTAVDYVYLNYGKENQKQLSTVTTSELSTYIQEGHFAPGSMLPKIEAMLDFVHSSQAMGIITSPANIEEALVTGRGTTIVP